MLYIRICNEIGGSDNIIAMVQSYSYQKKCHLFVAKIVFTLVCTLVAIQMATNMWYFPVPTLYQGDSNTQLQCMLPSKCQGAIVVAVNCVFFQVKNTFSYNLQISLLCSCLCACTTMMMVVLADRICLNLVCQLTYVLPLQCDKLQSDLSSTYNMGNRLRLNYLLCWIDNHLVWSLFGIFSLKHLWVESC